MISQCSVCDETYSTKDFIEAKRRLCPVCKAKQPTSVEGEACSVERDNKSCTSRPVDGRITHPADSTGNCAPTQKDCPPEADPTLRNKQVLTESKKTGLAPGTFVPKPDDKFNYKQKPLVWAK